MWWSVECVRVCLCVLCLYSVFTFNIFNLWTPPTHIRNCCSLWFPLSDSMLWIQTIAAEYTWAIRTHINNNPSSCIRMNLLKIYDIFQVHWKIFHYYVQNAPWPMDFVQCRRIRNIKGQWKETNKKWASYANPCDSFRMHRYNQFHIGKND